MEALVFQVLLRALRSKIHPTNHSLVFKDIKVTKALLPYFILLRDFHLFFQPSSNEQYLAKLCSVLNPSLSSVDDVKLKTHNDESRKTGNFFSYQFLKTCKFLASSKSKPYIDYSRATYIATTIQAYFDCNPRIKRRQRLKKVC